MTPEYVEANPEEAAEAREGAINLGLDLQGGIHMVLGIKYDKLKQNILLNSNKRISDQFQEKGIAVIAHRVSENGNAIEVEINPAAADDRWNDIEDAVAQMSYLDEPERVAVPNQNDRIIVRASINKDALDREVREATGRALEIIRNRIDAFGVSEPSIQQSGDRKIVVQLPGAADPARARSLIGRTAQLQFHRTNDDAKLNNVITALDKVLNKEILKIVRSAQLGENSWDIRVNQTNKDKLVELLSRPAAGDALPDNTKVFIGKPKVEGGQTFLPLFLLEEVPAMTGKNLEMARVFYDERNRPGVSFQFNSDGAQSFGELTAELAQIEGRLAIVLDDVVQSAPTVNSVITKAGQITGSFTHDEARDLAVVLRSGALPAPVEILEDRTIGPSLGADSIRKGVQACTYGLILVIIFMLIRYRTMGFIADICLGLNLFIVLAFMNMPTMKATLTLPGIAGLVLVIGMAVDANILIIERIKEEMRAGKGIFNAIQSGYDKAFGTIFDANVTTLITAMALYEYGTGPIRGFAVTLSIGILCSMFTSVFVSRTLVDKFILSSDDPKLSL